MDKALRWGGKLTFLLCFEELMLGAWWQVSLMLQRQKWWESPGTLLKAHRVLRWGEPKLSESFFMFILAALLFLLWHTRHRQLHFISKCWKCPCCISYSNPESVSSSLYCFFVLSTSHPSPFQPLRSPLYFSFASVTRLYISIFPTTAATPPSPFLTPRTSTAYPTLH